MESPGILRRTINLTLQPQQNQESIETLPKVANVMPTTTINCHLFFPLLVRSN